MANAVYPLTKEKYLAKTGPDMDSDAIIAVLSDAADYTYSAAHDFYDDLTAAARVAISGTLTSPTVALGVFDTADFVWSTVTGDQAEQVILVDNTPATEATKWLVIFYDTGMTGMPVAPNGGNINGTVNASGWFAL